MGNHWKFSSTVEAAIHQASDYSDFFELELNRVELERRTGIKVFRPRLLIVCGRSTGEVDPLDMKSLASRYRDTEIKSYDDLYHFAKDNYESTNLIAVPIVQNFPLQECGDVLISINLDKLSESTIVRLRQTLDADAGSEIVYFRVSGGGLSGSSIYLTRKHTISPTHNFISSIRKLGKNITLQTTSISSLYKDSTIEEAPF